MSNPKAIKKALEDFDADTIFGGLPDASKLHEVRVLDANGNVKRVIDVDTLLKRELEISEKKRKFNANL